MTRTGFPARLRISHESRRLNTSYRRNGKLQSCEPCRKGKLKCDHMMPACGRCLRRNKEAQCVYHPAPLTKTSRSPPCEGQNHTNSADAVMYEDTSIRRPPATDSVNSQSGLSDTIIPGTSLSVRSGAGFTAHSAILAENESRLGITYVASTPTADTIKAISPARLQKGADTLSLLKDMTLFNRFIDMWFSLTRGIVVMESMVKQWTTVLWSTWHTTLESQKAESLLVMSERVWLNTVEPLTLLRTTTPREFVAGTTGENLRWEVVGIIFSVVGMLAVTLQDGDPIFCSHDDPPMDRYALARKAFDAAETCSTFCKDFDILNDPFLWLLYENFILSTALHSKGSYSNWQKFGELINALLAFGLHQEIKVDDDTPFFIAEFRKKIFVSAYSNDKFFSSSIGRPPRLTRQYCLLQLPLDLSDSQLMSDGLELDAAIAGLDDEGWNQRGTIQRCTFARIWSRKGAILEDILDISLGVLPQTDIVRRAEEIEQASIAMWENLPSFLRLDPENPWDIRRAPIELLFLFYIRLEILYHRFLLQRTLIKKVSTDSRKLLAISHEMLSYILVFINNRDSMRDYQLDFTTILCIHGLPAAAVIAVELLHQEQNPPSKADRLPRSNTIQDLSVIVACLGSIRPESSGYSNCKRGHRFLKRILDTILDPAPILTSDGDTNEMNDTILSTPLFQTGSDEGFMRWLENMEWEQDCWTNFN